MNWDAPQEWLANTHLFRCFAGTLFRSFARRRVAALDHQAPERCQAHSLISLVHRAHATRFGRDHDFRRVRNPDDFRRLVPLRSPGDFWRTYWQTTFPDLANATWPGTLPWLTSVEPSPGGPRFVPLSRELARSHRIAGLTALALVQVVRPRARPFLGRALLLTEAPPPAPIKGRVHSGGFGGTILRTLPPLWRPFLLGPGGDRATWTARRDVTCVLGEPGRMLAFFEQLLAGTGRDRVVDLWPNLTTVMTTRSSGPLRARLASVLGEPSVAILEFCFRPEAVLAVEDPRHGQLRLLSDHGVYWEFIPREELGRPRPTRHGLEAVEPGVPYAVAVTSPAGLWACPLGFTVCFSRRGSPLLEWARYTPAEPPSSLPLQPPHVRPAVRRAIGG